MPSRAETRRALEWVLRAGALGLLAWALVAAASDAEVAGGVRIATLDTAGTERQLGSWTRAPDLRRLHVSLRTAPDARTRSWMRALAGAGTVVSWSGEIPAVAIEAETIADPRGGVELRVAAPHGTTVQLRDAVGEIDSVTATGGGGSVRAASVSGAVEAHAPGVLAHVRPPATRHLRTVVLIGAAGWESRFVAAALEERGWHVSVRMRVAPGLSVGGAIPSLDTAGVSAVVALDSTAAGDAGAIVRYLRDGGGVVLAPGAARLRAFAAITAGRTGATRQAATSYAAAIAPVTRQGLATATIASLRPDAVVLDTRGNDVLVAGRRIDAGRVLQLGYDETWRWRMAGGPEGPDAHRAWWSGVVSAVAYAPPRDDGPREATTATAASPEPTPRASLVGALGRPQGPPVAAAAGGAFDPGRSLAVYIAAALLLLAEWASRRLRGAR